MLILPQYFSSLVSRRRCVNQDHTAAKGRKTQQLFLPPVSIVPVAHREHCAELMAFVAFLLVQIPPGMPGALTFAVAYTILAAETWRL